MKRRSVLLIIAATLIGLTVLVFLYPHLMVSPGPVIPAHANIEASCFSCHSPFRGASADRCITCHKVADIGLRTTAGKTVQRAAPVTPFHQGLTAQNCMDCHTGHTNTVLTSMGRPAFSHALLNAAIRQNCASCHVAPKTAVHSGATGQCTQCHGQDHWKPATFDHTRFFALDQDHNAPCLTCHTTSDRRQYTCFGCHEHTLSNIRAKHIREGIPNFTNCVSCHKSAHGEAREGREREDD